MLNALRTKLTFTLKVKLRSITKIIIYQYDTKEYLILN